MAANKKCAINKKMLPVKVTYACELGAVASLLPYLGVYMFSIGLTYSELSIIYGTSPFITAVLRTPVGMIADKLQKHKVILMMCCIFSGVCHSMLLLTPKASQPVNEYSVCQAPVSIHCVGTDNYLETSCKGSNDMLCVNGGNCTTMPSNKFTNASTCQISCTTVQDICLEPQSSVLSLAQPCTVTKSEQNSADIKFTVRNLHSVGGTYGGIAECPQYSMEYIQYSGETYARVSCPATTDAHLLSCLMTCETTSPPQNVSTCQTYEDTRQAGEGAQPFGKTFWFFFIMFLIGQIFYTPIFSLIDAIVYDYLGPDAGEWGKHRLWASVGYAFCALLSGITMDTFNFSANLSEGRLKLIFAFVAFAVLSIAGGIVVFFFKISPEIVATSMMKNLGSLFRSFEVVLLFVCMLMYGFYTGIIETFLYIHLETLGAPKLLMGLCMVIGCLPELIIFFCAGKIIQKLGYCACLCIVYMAYAIRLIGYAFLQNPWYVLLIEPLHSITFALMYASVSAYATTLTPAGMHGTIQSIIGTLYFGFGKGAGSIVSGQVYHAYGAKPTFLGFGVSSLGLLLIYVVLYLLVIRKNHKAPAEKSAGDSDTKELETSMINSAKDHKKSLDNKKSHEEEHLMNGHQTETDRSC